MKKILAIPLFTVTVSMLMSHTGVEHVAAYNPTDSTQIARDTAVSVYDTLSEVEVKAKKELSVVEAINNSLKNGPTMPKQKSISDVLGKKTTDYIMHPFAWKDRRKEKNLKKTKENLLRLEAAKSYEDELTEAINRQLREDSIAEAKKKMRQERDDSPGIISNEQ